MHRPCRIGQQPIDNEMTGTDLALVISSLLTSRFIGMMGPWVLRSETGDDSDDRFKGTIVRAVRT